MDGLVGAIGSAVTFGWKVHGRFKDLGKTAKKLDEDIKTLTEQLETAQSFVEVNPENLGPKLQQRLRNARAGCQKAFEMANQCVTDYRSDWYRFKGAVISDDEIETLRQVLRDCTTELGVFNVDSNLEITVAIRNEQLRLRERPNPEPLRAEDIPENTPDPVEKILLEGRCIDERDPDGYTPLQIACELGNVPLVKLLLQRGASILTRTTNLKDTILHIAADSGHTSVLEAIEHHLTRKRRRARVGGEGYRRKKSRQERERVGRQTWDELVQSVNKKGQLPLHTAAERGETAAARRLIDALKAIDSNYPLLDTPDFFGTTPMHVAAANGATDVLDLLLQEGANPRVKDDQGRRPIGLARENKHEGCLVLLEGAKRKVVGRGEVKEQKKRAVKEKATAAAGDEKAGEIKFRRRRRILMVDRAKGSADKGEAAVREEKGDEKPSGERAAAEEEAAAPEPVRKVRRVRRTEKAKSDLPPSTASVTTPGVVKRVKGGPRAGDKGVVSYVSQVVAPTKKARTGL